MTTGEINSGPDDYDPTWDEVRRLEKMAHRWGWAFFATFPMAALLAAINWALPRSMDLQWLSVPLAAYALATAIACLIYGTRCIRFPCPRCGHVFVHWRREKCAHCGLWSFESKNWKRIDLTGKL